jgi:hypothetical protein
MLTAGGVQFVVGCMLEGEQSIVGIGYGQEDLVELALGRTLMAGLGVLDDEDHVPAAVTTKIAARGRDAYRSTLDSHRLTRDLDSPRAGGGSATEPGNRC